MRLQQHALYIYISHDTQNSQYLFTRNRPVPCHGNTFIEYFMQLCYIFFSSKKVVVTNSDYYCGRVLAVVGRVEKVTSTECAHTKIMQSKMSLSSLKALLGEVGGIHVYLRNGRLVLWWSATIGLNWPFTGKLHLLLCKLGHTFLWKNVGVFVQYVQCFHIQNEICQYIWNGCIQTYFSSHGRISCWRV